MWNNRSWLFLIKLKIKGEKPRIRLNIPISILVMRQFLLSFDGVLVFCRGKMGKKIRNAVGVIHIILLSLLKAKPQNYVNIDVGDSQKQVLVCIKTVGWKVGEIQ